MAALLEISRTSGLGSPVACHAKFFYQDSTPYLRCQHRPCALTIVPAGVPAGRVFHAEPDPWIYEAA